MKLFELYNFLEKTFPKEYSCDWDNDGLMCAVDMNADVKKVLCTLDITDAALEFAINNGFDTIISHHPMIFRPLGSITAENHIANKAIFSIKNSINVFSFHTRFDAMPGGINDLLANKLGLSNIKSFGNEEGDMGRIGTVDETDIVSFCRDLKSKLGCDVIHVSKHKNTVKTVAVLGGAGKDFIKSALYAGADVFVSGELGYNNMVEAPEMGISLIEAGHFFTEDVACEFFKGILDDLGIENGYFSSYNIFTV